MNLQVEKRRFTILSKKKRKLVGQALLVSFLTLFSIIMILPFIIMVFTSFKTAAEINSFNFHLFPQSINFNSYFEMFSRGDWGRYFLNSVFITVVVTVTSLFINALAGYAFARVKFRGNNIFFLVLMIGLMVPIQVQVLPVFMIIKNIPLLGGNDWLGQGGMGLVDTYLGLMLPLLSGAFGVFLCRQFYVSFPSALDEAAEIDGCNYWKVFYKIYLPQSKSLLLSLGIIKITATWNDYMWTLVAVRSEHMKTLQLALASLKSEAIQWEVLMAATTFVAFPIILIFLINQKWFTQGVATTGMKN